MTDLPQPRGIAARLADAALSMGSEPNFAATLEAIVREAQKSIPGTDHAGLSLIVDGKIETAAPTSPLVEQIDEYQYKFGEGPCVDAIFEAEVYRTGDMSAEHRWPDFSTAAADAGVASMLAFRLHLDGRTQGALNLYSSQHDAFDDAAVHTGQPFAAHAAIALAHSREKLQLLDALDSRDVIGMAKGIIMQKYCIDDERAFSVLVALSQHGQEKLRDVAGHIVEECRAEARDSLPKS
ncbi:GAF and ANTAR domain-containing protein [Hoyosella rhizosphaerae]|uniref:GAF and ANTAR domain-containing protein n=1 Tax=Hoyosella rhizosphaerae TaxID=1755582 RepID=UPI00197F19D6|nr:GAF and ANTAR domain-containing protein [Hoyosella rhizosphaerae]MBN4927588.1 GAF and ANTAR domain-containing protein [Hoyosella rhizosphaerae]